MPRLLTDLSYFEKTIGILLRRARSRIHRILPTRIRDRDFHERECIQSRKVVNQTLALQEEICDIARNKVTHEVTRAPRHTQWPSHPLQPRFVPKTEKPMVPRGVARHASALHT